MRDSRRLERRSEFQREFTFGLPDPWVSTASDAWLDCRNFSPSPPPAALTTTYSLTSPISVTEGGQATFTISRTGDKPSETLYFSALADGSANWDERDFSTTSGGRPLNIAIVFSSGESSETVKLNILEDGQNDSGESFRVIIQRDDDDPASIYLLRSDFITIYDAGKPDLIIEDVEFNGEQVSYGEEVSVRAGEEVTLGWDVRNRGDGDAALSRAGIYLVRDGLPAEFLDWESSGSLDAGEVENDETDTFVIPANLAPGLYGIEIRADHEAVVAESDEGNNEFLILIRVEGTAPPASDDYRDEATDTSAPLGSLDEQDPTKTGLIGPPDANDSFGDKDVFRVTLTQGQTYLFTMTGASVSGFGALSQSIFTVRSGSNFNTILATSSEGATAQMEFYAAAGGTYYLRTGAGGPNHTTIQGGYRVTLQPANDGTIDISSQLQGSGSYSKVGYVGGGDPLDVFTLMAPTGGGELTVDLTGLSADVDIRILTEHGGLLDESILNGTAAEHASVTLAAGQRVRIEVDPYGSAQSAYQLNVQFTAVPVPPVTSLPNWTALIGNHLHRTLADFAAGAYANSLGTEARTRLANEGWHYYKQENVSGTSLSDLDWEGIFFDNDNAQATVARAEDAIVISFRGTDTWADRLNWGSMSAHYDELRDFVAAVDNLIKSDSRINRVFVTGHSLGAAMVDLYMASHTLSWDDALDRTVQFRAITFAHPDVFDINIFRPDLPNIIDPRVISFHNINDVINNVDSPGGITPYLSTILSYTQNFSSFYSHSMQLYSDGVSNLYQAGIDYQILTVGLGGPRQNHFLVPAPGEGADNTLVSLNGSLLMAGGQGNDVYDVVPHLTKAGDTIIETGNGTDVLHLRAISGGSGLGWFQGTVHLTLGANGRDLIVHPMSLGIFPNEMRAIRIFNHFTSGGRVEWIQWGNSLLELPSSTNGIDGWNGAHYKLVSLADIQFAEAPDGTISGFISATGGSGATDTVSFGDLRNAVTVSLLDGVASILDALDPSDLAPSGAASATGPANSIPVDITNMENVTGSSVDDSITGSDLANFMEGGSGNDLLVGLAGSDMLDGGEGEDRLNGGAGSDSMIGGSGDDQFRVDELGDRIFEAIGGGRDTVFVDATYVLSEDAEVEIIAPTDLDGLLAINLTGNAFGQEIWGNAGANTLSGEAGNDFIFGGEGADRLFGGDGDDYLYGDAGADRLTGGAGADRFMFEFITDSRGYVLRSDGFKRLPDLITDFVSGEDKIDLSSIEPTESIHAFTFIGTNAFSGVAGQVRYEARNGYFDVFADADGNGSADLMFIVAATSLQATDFVL